MSRLAWPSASLKENYDLIRERLLRWPEEIVHAVAEAQNMSTKHGRIEFADSTLIEGGKVVKQGPREGQRLVVDGEGRWVGMREEGSS